MTGTYIAGLLVLALPVLSTVAYSAVKRRLGYPLPGSVWTGPDGHRWTVINVNGRKVRLRLDDGKPHDAPSVVTFTLAYDGYTG